MHSAAGKTKKEKGKGYGQRQERADDTRTGEAS